MDGHGHVVALPHCLSALVSFLCSGKYLERPSHGGGVILINAALVFYLFPLLFLLDITLRYYRPPVFIDQAANTGDRNIKTKEQ